MNTLRSDCALRNASLQRVASRVIPLRKRRRVADFRRFREPENMVQTVVLPLGRACSSFRPIPVPARPRPSRVKLSRFRSGAAVSAKLEHEPCLRRFFLACTLHWYPCVPVGTPILHRRPCGAEADRRPPVWRAVVRPARYFFARRMCEEKRKALQPACCRASLRMMGTKESKSTGFGTCRSKPASIAASTSLGDA